MTGDALSIQNGGLNILKSGWITSANFQERDNLLSRKLFYIVNRYLYDIGNVCEVVNLMAGIKKAISGLLINCLGQAHEVWNFYKKHCYDASVGELNPLVGLKFFDHGSKTMFSIKISRFLMIIDEIDVIDHSIEFVADDLILLELD